MKSIAKLAILALFALGLTYCGHHQHHSSKHSCSKTEKQCKHGEKNHAKNVKNKKTLSQFVKAAKRKVERNYSVALKKFKTSKRWKADNVYIFILSLDGRAIFHPVAPELEGTDLSQTKDKNGKLIFQELKKKANSGGGFVKYLWNTPKDKSHHTHKKISYVLPFERDGKTYLIGAGFYKN